MQMFEVMVVHAEPVLLPSLGRWLQSGYRYEMTEKELKTPEATEALRSRQIVICGRAGLVNTSTTELPSSSIQLHTKPEQVEKIKECCNCLEKFSDELAALRFEMLEEFRATRDSIALLQKPSRAKKAKI